MSDHNKPSADEREATIGAIESIVSLHDRQHGVAAIADLILAERRKADRQIEEAFHAGYDDGWDDAKSVASEYKPIGACEAFARLLVAQASPREGDTP